MQINIQEDHSSVCKKAAHEIAAALREKPNLNIGLATGNTMEPLYDELVRMQKEEGLDFSQAQFFQLDEFKDVPPSDEHSFNYAVHKLFLDKIGARDEQKHLMDGTNFNAEAFEQEIKNAGGIDIQLLGIGREGHIGFNEASSGAGEQGRTAEVKLATSTIEDSAAHWGGKDNVPELAYTQGVGTIMDAKKVIMIINGGHKAKIAHDMMSGGEVDELPGRALLNHPNASVFMDKPSTEMLTDEQLEAHTGMSTQEIAAHRDYFKPIEIKFADGGELSLPYNADIFIPDVMGIDEKFDPNNAKHVEGLKAALNHIKDTYTGAHQDDTELWVPHAIEENMQAQKEGKPNQFLSIIVTDGAAYTTALKRTAEFADTTPEQLIEMRKREQREAAMLFDQGHYPVIQLQYPSNTVKGYLGDEKTNQVVDSLKQIYDLLPEHQNAYTHHPSDIHDTHIACATLGVEALRQSKSKPTNVYSMLAWGGGISDKVFPVNDPQIVNDLLQKFRTQIEMQGREYAKNGAGNVRGNGFMLDPHAHPDAEGAVLGLDITASITQNKSLQAITDEAEAAKKQKRDTKVSRFSAPGSVEASHQPQDISHSNGNGWQAAVDRSMQNRSNLRGGGS